MIVRLETPHPRFQSSAGVVFLCRCSDLVRTLAPLPSYDVINFEIGGRGVSSGVNLLQVTRLPQDASERSCKVRRDFLMELSMISLRPTTHHSVYTLCGRYEMLKFKPKPKEAGACSTYFCESFTCKSLPCSASPYYS